MHAVPRHRWRGTAYQELLYVINQIGNQAPYGSPLIPAAIIGGSMHVAVCLLLSYIAYRLQRRAKRSPMAGPAVPDSRQHGGETNTSLIVLQGDGAEPTR